MPRRPVIAAWALCALLAGCGEGPPPAEKAGRPLTPEELMAKIRAGGHPNEDARRAAEEAAEQMRQAMGGGDLEEMSRKAKAFSARPLTPADVETYIVLLPKTRAVMGKPFELSTVLAPHGLTTAEWMVLNLRMNAIASAVQLPKDKVDPKIAADVETVRPYADRINAAHKTK